MAKIETIEEYMASLPEEQQKILKKVRETIQAVIPEATPTISYSIPAFKLDGKNVVFFSGSKDYVSLYPAPADKSLQKELAPYASGKSTVRFSIDEPIPYDLIKKIVTALVKENHQKS